MLHLSVSLYSYVYRGQFWGGMLGFVCPERWSMGNVMFLRGRFRVHWDRKYLGLKRFHFTNLACHPTHAFGGNFHYYLTDLACHLRELYHGFGRGPVCGGEFFEGGFFWDLDCGFDFGPAGMGVWSIQRSMGNVMFLRGNK
jgi:hypothetical protein